MWNPFRRRLGSGDLSENLKVLISLSRQEAIRLDNDFIHTVHFLLAILADGSSSVYKLLECTIPDMAAAKAELENIFKGHRTKQHGVVVAGSLPLTKDFETALHHAFQIASEQKAKRVEAFHVVLGVYRTPLSPAADILRNLGLGREKLRELNPTPDSTRNQLP